MLYPLYQVWNEKINLISRKDFPFFYERHVLHVLAIAKAFRFPEGSCVMDAGTGGGFPGIPLAVYFPEVHFHLVDATGKKIRAVEDIAGRLGLSNVSTEANRLEKVNRLFDFVVSRAVAPLDDMVKWTWKNISPPKKFEPTPGIIYLKGGDVYDELQHLKLNYQIIRIRQYFEEDFFENKLLIYLYR